MPWSLLAYQLEREPSCIEGQTHLVGSVWHVEVPKRSTILYEGSTGFYLISLGLANVNIFHGWRVLAEGGGGKNWRGTG